MFLGSELEKKTSAKERKETSSMQTSIKLKFAWLMIVVYDVNLSFEVRSAASFLSLPLRTLFHETVLRNWALEFPPFFYPKICLWPLTPLQIMLIS